MNDVMRDSAVRGLILRFQDRLAQLCILVSSLALVTLVATFGWLVFGRYVLNATPTWVEQLALLLVCYITFLGAGVGIHERSHLGVTMFRDAMPSLIQRIVLFGTDVVLAGFGAIMMLASLELFKFGWDTLLPMLNIPESFRTLSAMLCGALMFIFAGLRVVVQIMDLFSPPARNQNQEKEY